jgi:glycosyltransferase involved in cell wall biosynthesis
LKILILAPAPENISPSQRFRFEHYLSIEHNKNLRFTYKSFFSRKTWGILHLNNHYFQKALGIASGFARRFALLFNLHQYDWVYIHREAAPIGPPVFEWTIAKIWRKKIIYDFDDAIWVSTASVANPGVAMLKCTWKVAKICKLSTIVTVGNDFLGEYARKYCKDVRVIPTVVNTNTQHNRIKEQDNQSLVIGWTGTFTNFYNLDKITPVLARLKQNYPFTFLVISDKDPGFTDVDYVYKKWKVDTEIDDLLALNIGLMPLENSEVELGKCAFKAIQYMSLGIPAVVSPVGTNKEVIQNAVNGYWANNEEEWYDILEMLIKDSRLRTEMGKSARDKIVAHYSTQATQEDFFNLFFR